MNFKKTLEQPIFLLKRQIRNKLINRHTRKLIRSLKKDIKNKIIDSYFFGKKVIKKLLQEERKERINNCINKKDTLKDLLLKYQKTKGTSRFTTSFIKTPIIENNKIIPKTVKEAIIIKLTNLIKNNNIEDYTNVSLSDIISKEYPQLNKKTISKELGLFFKNLDSLDSTTNEKIKFIKENLRKNKLKYISGKLIIGE